MGKVLKTDQEKFWEGQFGDDYADRNAGATLVAAKTAMFAQALRRAHGIASVRELGANTGLNIRALQTLLPAARFQAIEINPKAYDELKRIPGIAAVCGSLFDPMDAEPVDLAFTAGMMIHLNPDRLPDAYARLYEASLRYVLISEYYSPSPVEIAYRGHAGKLFKRDFAGEMMTRYPDLRLIDYGFIYHLDPIFPGDDLNWFLLEKRSA